MRFFDNILPFPRLLPLSGLSPRLSSPKLAQPGPVLVRFQSPLQFNDQLFEMLLLLPAHRVFSLLQSLMAQTAVPIPAINRTSPAAFHQTLTTIAMPPAMLIFRQDP
jgi:hypothetical protein